MLSLNCMNHRGHAQIAGAFRLRSYVRRRCTWPISSQRTYTLMCEPKSFESSRCSKRQAGELIRSNGKLAMTVPTNLDRGFTAKSRMGKQVHSTCPETNLPARLTFLLTST